MDQGSLNNRWYIIGVVVVVVAALWYFYGGQAPTVGTETSAVEQAQIPTLTGGDTTADISADFSQIPDTSAALDADAAAITDDLQSL